MSRKRIRAHANPLSDVDVDWPLTPDAVPWNEYYPAYIGAGNVPLPAATASASVPSASALSPSPSVPSLDSLAAGTAGGLSEVRVADVGCGFGGMSVALAEIFPDKLVLGLEIRDAVVNIVRERITKLRKEAAAAAKSGAGEGSAAQGSDAAASSSSGAVGAAASGESFHRTQSACAAPAPWVPHAPSYALSAPTFTYQNVACVQTNFMKYAVNYFRPGQLERVFFLFQDPHFKKANWRRRVISHRFLAVYAHVLRVGGLMYTITDVPALHEWQTEHLDAHPLFERVPDESLASDPCYIAMQSATEEGQKVTRLSGQKMAAVYRRIEAKEVDEPTE